MTVAAALVLAAGPVAPMATADDRSLRAVASILRAPAQSLRATEPIEAPGGGSIERYRQRVSGLAVLGGEAVVVRPASGRAEVIADRTVPGLERAPAARISEPDAIARGMRASRVERLRAATRARLVVTRAGRTAWEVLLPAAKPLADIALLVDARSGRILRKRDLLRRAGLANLFIPNPVVTQGNRDGLRDGDDRDSPRLSRQLRPVTLERLESVSGCLRGVYVEARVGFKAKKVCVPDANFSGVTRSDRVFEALMAYHHIDQTRAYIESLALSGSLRQKPLIVEANSLAADNSFYSPITRRIGLGAGGVDDGEDADVIVHEYGHAVQDQAARFFGETVQGAAMGEGFGDYLAATMSSRVTGGNPSFDACMFEWDAISYTDRRCARSTATALTAPRAEKRCPSPHCVGEAWSGALYELRGELGLDAAAMAIMDRVVLESNFMLSRRSNFRAGARALLAADRLLYGGAHVPAIERELVQRGFCKKRGC